MRKSLLYGLILCSSILSAQEEFRYEFEPLEVVDTIRDSKKIQEFKNGSQYIAPDLFIKKRAYYSNGLILFKKMPQYWLALQLPADNSLEDINVTVSGRYLHYTTYYTHAARGVSGSNSEFHIINAENLTTVNFMNSYTLEQWNTEDENDEETHTETCTAQIIFENGELISLSTSENSECIGSGVFKIDGNRLLKIKRYDASRSQMVPIRWVGNIATSMTLEDVKLIYPDAEYKEVDNRYGTCAEGDWAYEIWDRGTYLAHVVLDGDNKIVRMVVTDANYNFGKVHVRMTVGGVFKLYPNSELYIDLLDEREHLYIKELNIILFFDTDQSNRIGKYKDEDFIKLQRKDAKVDFIVVD